MGKIIENPIFIIPVVAGFVFIVAGLIMLKFPPNKINFLYGYRTNSSMKSQEIWQFAQKYSAREMIKIGSILTCSSLFGFVFNYGQTKGVFFGISLLILTAILVIIRVEKAIKNKFKNK